MFTPVTTPIGTRQRDLIAQRTAELGPTEHQEIFRILQSHGVPYTKNNNGIFVNLSYVKDEIIKELQGFVDFCFSNKSSLDEYDKKLNACKLNNKYETLMAGGNDDASSGDDEMNRDGDGDGHDNGNDNEGGKDDGGFPSASTKTDVAGDADDSTLSPHPQSASGAEHAPAKKEKATRKSSSAEQMMQSSSFSAPQQQQQQQQQTAADETAASQAAATARRTSNSKFNLAKKKYARRRVATTTGDGIAPPAAASSTTPSTSSAGAGAGSLAMTTVASLTPEEYVM